MGIGIESGEVRLADVPSGTVRQLGALGAERDEVVSEVETERVTAAESSAGRGSADQTAEDFTGTDRFLIQRRLGAGAFGVVYEAYDRRTGGHVALKVLRFAEADSLYRFKKGFRALADIRHPNLVDFYELWSLGGLWFFSMELVPGVDFVEALSGSRGDDPAGASATPDFDRIRRLVAQLAAGLHTVHLHGKVHRDIKPPNVLVTGDDRAVLLDFGLVTELQRVGGIPSVAPRSVGTPAYMSPEQALALPDSPAGDWYSVGVMLYQCLTGDLPFQGSTLEILASKQTSSPPPMTGVPGDLEELCFGLLDPDPEQRLGGPEVLSRLGSGAASAVAPAPTTSQLATPFVGRESILAELEDAFAASRHRSVTVYLRGASGMGKSTMIERFIERLDALEEPPVVLTGRCYLQESVPYKALDSLIDTLSRYLSSLPVPEIEELLPQQVASMAVLFPVLLRIGPMATAPEEGLDPQHLRRRAFTGLRELLARLAERRPLVLVIDDLQWGDIDSFLLLDELFKPPEPPPLLLIGCYRSEDEGSSRFLRALAEHRESLRWRGVDVREIEIGGLSRDQARDLLRRLESEGYEIPADQEDGILREAEGNPLFLSELTRFSRDRPPVASAAAGRDRASSGETAAGVELREVILARVETLPAATQRLLKVISVAGKPLDLEAASQAAEIVSETPAALARLRAERLIRQRDCDGWVEIEAYHDRIREAVADSLERPELRRYHRRLALALESSGRADPETLAVHFQATEEVVRAREYAATAAARAEEALAFERAVRLYRLALSLFEDEGPERYRLQVRLGEALANAGRSREAAESFLQAVGHSGPIDPIEAQRHAAEQLLISGHIDRGMAILRHVLRTTGMRLPRRSWKALLALWWHRLRLRLRGYRFEERAPEDLDPAQQQRIDACWSVEIGLCLVDVLRASQFHARHLLLAQASGDSERVARGMAMEVFFGAMEGVDVAWVLERARELANRQRGQYAACLTEMASGMWACSEGDWRAACRRLERAERRLEEARSGVAWELDTVRHFRVLAMWHLGQWPALFGELPCLLEPAREQGDLYLEIHLRHWVESFQHLVEDRPQAAREILGESIRDWSHQGFHFQHFGHLFARTQVDLYEGHGRQAWHRVREVWSDLTSSMIQRIEMVLVLSHDLRARCALAAAAAADCDPGMRSWFLDQAEAGARRLERAGSKWSQALASLLRAGHAALLRRDTEADRHLANALTAFDELGMEAHVAVALARRASLGVDGAELDAGRLLSRLGVERPERVAAVIAPGHWRPDERTPATVQSL